MKWLEIILPLCLALALLFPPGYSDVQAKQTAKPQAAKKLTLDLGKGVTMKLVLIPTGGFLMGGKFTPGQAVKRFGGKEIHYAGERPQHKVTITKPFYMGVCEVTQAQWKAVMGSEPWVGKVSGKPGNQNAASWLSWNEAGEFCRKLSKNSRDALLYYWFCIVEAASSRFESRGWKPRLRFQMGPVFPLPTSP